MKLENRFLLTLIKWILKIRIIFCNEQLNDVFKDPIMNSGVKL